MSQELKDRAKACKTPEELIALAKEEGLELTNEQLQGVAGGASPWAWDCDDYVDNCPSDGLCQH